ncbi:MAG TPA: CHAT domain-containing protein [Pirellulaceae bacterium]|nr:CHAT domain-containing protein [Pirellulaceae bacterium]HMP68432.1 CHAT domain-containing protein [Pirellulaceae bacterium]
MRIRAPLSVLNLLAFALVFQFGGLPAAGQNVPRTQSLPNQRYYDALPLYYAGDYSRALTLFRAGATGAYQDSNGRFLDSICFFTMMGECNFQVGNYVDAIEQYEAAISLYTNLSNWPRRTTFPTQIVEAANATSQARINWWTSGRGASIGVFPKMSVMIGDIDALERTLRDGGGAVNPAALRSVDIPEVMRCAALAIHRRNVIKGPVNKHDPFTRNMLTQLSANRSGVGTMSGVWQAVLYGLAQSSAGQDAQAATTLNQALQINGFDHPSTPIALLEMGFIASRKEEFSGAIQLFMESAYCGALFQQYDIVADALHAATIAQMQLDRSQVFAPLPTVAEWANRVSRSRSLTASAIGDWIWATAESGAADEAVLLIAQNASRTLRQGNLSESRTGTLWLYASALANSIKGDGKSAARDLERFLEAASRTSLWLYQVALADSLVVSNRVAERAADALYSEVLRDPTRQDWLYQPMESIAFLVSPHIAPMRRWHAINIRLRADTKALEITDLIRRHRYFNALPLGGRDLALRWVATAPAEGLSENAKKQQAELLSKYPRLKELATSAENLARQLRSIPVTPPRNSEAIRNQKAWLDELTAVETERELLLQAIALRREPCEMAFPPFVPLQQIQSNLTDKQLIIACFFDGDQYYINLISKNSYSSEATIAAQTVDQELNKFFKEMGLGVQGGTLPLDGLDGDGWRQAARTISAMLFPRVRPDLLNNYSEVIVVPDGALWYFPFELLQIGNTEQSENLCDSIDVRYAPTLSTVFPDQRRRQRFPKMLVVTGRTHTRDDASRSTQAFEELKKSIANAEVIDKSSKLQSNLISTFVGQVIVWDDIDGTKPSMALSPMSYDAGRTGGSLANWTVLPWSNVDQLILPGFRSGVGGARVMNLHGEELFLLSCSMLASGTKSMLISRWPVGGATTLELTKQFAIESNHVPPLQAWRRSLQLLKETEVDAASEPRVRDSRVKQQVKAEHPVFWASYLWIDLAAAELQDNDDQIDQADDNNPQPQDNDNNNGDDGGD